MHVQFSLNHNMYSHFCLSGRGANVHKIIIQWSKKSSQIQNISIHSLYVFFLHISVLLETARNQVKETQCLGLALESETDVTFITFPVFIALISKNFSHGKQINEKRNSRREKNLWKFQLNEQREKLFLFGCK